MWADEPTGALDSESAAEVLALLRELHDDGLTLILVTHDTSIGEAAPRLVRMRDGRVVSDRRLPVMAGAGHTAVAVGPAIAEGGVR